VSVANETDRRQAGTLRIVAPEQDPGDGSALDPDGDTSYEMAFDLDPEYKKREQTDLTGVEYTVAVRLEAGPEHRAEWRWQGCRDDVIVTSIDTERIMVRNICYDD
jgi:hypothetical protein